MQPLSYGQLSVWRDIEGVPRKGWHQANSWCRFPIPDEVETGRVRQALRALAVHHPSLRTRYDFTDPDSPRQLVAAAGDDVEIIEGGLDGDLMAEIADLVNRPFDLRSELGWRIRIVTENGRPAEVIMIKHHMAADGWCNDVLQEDFRTFLHDPAAASVAAGPLDLAAWQHAAQQERTRAAVAAYWEKIFAFGAGGGFPGTDPAGAPALRCTFRSSRAHAHASELAARTKTSLSSVVLGAFSLAVARVAGMEAFVAQTMCSNRFSPQWRRVVTSMNQWAAVPLTAVDDLAEQSTRAHRAVMTAYRYGMYDVDTMAELQAAAARRNGGDYQAPCAYNFLTVPHLTGSPSDDDEFVWDEPFSTIGHDCYLRAAEEAGSSLVLRIRTKGIEQERVAAVMKDLHALLVG